MKKKTSSPPLIRLGHPLAFSAFLRHIGAPAERYFRQNMLPALCEDPNMFVPLARVWSFFADTEQHVDPMLGWLVGAHIGDHNLNAGLLQKLQTAPTLYLALQRLVEMANTEASHIQLGIHERRDDICVYTHYAGMRDIPGYRTSQAYQLGVILDLIRHFLGRQWVPKEIGIEHAIEKTSIEANLPGFRVLTHQPIGYIAVPRSCLHRAAHSNKSNNHVADRPAIIENLDYIDSLRMVLKAYLADGYPCMSLTADLMGVSERTLARRLSASGLTYGKLIDEVRFAESKKLLQNPDMRIADVALSIGFDDQSHFTRMFRRIGGLSPSTFRKMSLTKTE